MSRQPRPSFAPRRCRSGRLARSIAAAVEHLEARRLFAGDPAAVRPLPFALEWATDNGQLTDRDGTGTGFGYVYANKLGDEYRPDLIDVDTAAGVLRLTSSGTAAAGGNYNDDNTQTNALAAQFDASTTAVAINARLVGPLTDFDANVEQAGILFGPDQDNYVKLVVAHVDGQAVVQFIDEQVIDGQITHAVAPGSSFKRVVPFSTMKTLDLRLIADPVTGLVQGFYKVNGAAYQRLAQKVMLNGDRKDAFFSSVARAGLMVAHKNDLGPVTATFDSFGVSETTAVPPSSQRPSVTASRPGPNDANVGRDAFVAADVRLVNPGHGVDPGTLTPQSVRLYRQRDGAEVPARRNTSGGGDAVVLQPAELLDANTTYVFELTDAVADTTGTPFNAYTFTFTTGTSGGAVDPSIAFEQVALPTAQGELFTGVGVGPDGRLYAGTFDGKIYRWGVNDDGTLRTPKVIETVIDANGGARTITGFAFEPGRDEDDVALWVAHGQSALVDAADWTGKLSRLRGEELEDYDDVVVDLPRSIKDHLTNQPAFGPDGALYLSQGSNTSMGAADPVWGNRPEHLLNAAILRVDTAALLARLRDGDGPLSVKTAEGGTYDPSAERAPVTPYATGVRNAFDLVFHSSGRLYAPVNGAAAGGNTPAGGGAPALTDVRSTQDDLLIDVVAGGYYGHPNPSRGEFVLFGGNPTAGLDADEVMAYPPGVAPDPNYRGAVHRFGRNYSPDGAAEYTGDAFGGKLKGRLLVARYSGGDDVVVMGFDDAGHVNEFHTGVAGLTNLADPLDVAEDPRTGFVYVTEFGASRVTLLRPIAAGARASLATGTAPDPATGGDRLSISGPAGAARVVTITNTGTADLALPADAFTLTGPDATRFTLTKKPKLPAVVAAGASVTFTVAAVAGTNPPPPFASATLTIKTNDTTRPLIDVDLRLLTTTGTGGANEPSLQRIFDFHDLPISAGDDDPSDVYLTAPPGAGDELLGAQSFRRAGAGPVTVETLAVYGVSAQPAVRFGLYEAGTPGGGINAGDGALDERLVVDRADAQSVSPVARGAATFDPGAGAFGLYTVWPGFDNRVVYSEDALNTWEPDAAQRHKVRVYPLKNADGSAVADAYVVAFEEYTAGYDFQDYVAIVRNVRPVGGAGPEIGVANLDGSPLPGVLAFNRIENPHPDGLPDNVVHDTAAVRILNSGAAPLVVSALTVEGPWELIDPSAPPASIEPGASLDVAVRFVATAGRVSEGRLLVASNDADEPLRAVVLRGYWQPESENEQEPTLPETLRLLGFTTVTAFAGQSLDDDGRRDNIGEEILAGSWSRADASRPVAVRQLAAFHTQGNTTTLNWHDAGSSSVKKLFTSAGAEGQSLLPHSQGDASAPAAGTFAPAGAFGFRVDNDEWSDDDRNDEGEHHVRFYPARGEDGLAIADAWLMVMDYAGINYDYNDNVFLITNARPTGAPAAAVGVAATVSDDGAVRVAWGHGGGASVSRYEIYRTPASPLGEPELIEEDLDRAATTYLDAGGAAGGTYRYEVVAVGESGQLSAPAGALATIPPDGTSPGPDPDPGPGPDPSPGPGETPLEGLSSTDVGAVAAAGSTTASDTGYDLTAAGGKGVAGRADAVRFASRQQTGDFDVAVRVAALTGRKSARAGLLARASLDAGAAGVFASAAAGKKGAQLARRLTDGAKAKVAAKGRAPLPNAWLRLARAGDTFTAYASADGQTWTEFARVTADLPDTVYLGIAVAAGHKSASATAEFRDVG